jgi:predicted transcriptional regulator
MLWWSAHRPAPAVQTGDIMALLRAGGGSLRTTTRRLGAELGRPAATIHSELRRLAADGLISVEADSRGRCIALAASRRPN